MHKASTAVLVVGVVSSMAAAAQAYVVHYQCQVAPTSSLNQSAVLSLPLAGTWIGNYDAATNPTGTKTIPGPFGGSTNTAIPFSSTVNATVAVENSNPAGSFELGFDAVAGTVTVNKLFLDALPSQSGSIETELVLTFSTFHTTNPNSIYFGVNNFALPMGGGKLTRADATQTGEAVGTATPAGSGQWNFALAVPVDYMIEGNALGQAFGGDPVPSVLAVVGTITNTSEGITVSISADSDVSQPIPPLGDMTAQPFDLPTIFPPGSTAHLLVTGTFGKGSIEGSVDTQIVALGVMIGTPGDLNNDGFVDGADLGTLLGAWGTPAADLNGDGTTDGADLGTLLGNWS